MRVVDKGCYCGLFTLQRILQDVGIVRRIRIEVGRQPVAYGLGGKVFGEAMVDELLPASHVDE